MFGELQLFCLVRLIMPAFWAAGKDEADSPQIAIATVKMSGVPATSARHYQLPIRTYAWAIP